MSEKCVKVKNLNSLVLVDSRFQK